MKYLFPLTLILSSAVFAATGSGEIKGQGMNSESEYRRTRQQEAGGSVRNSQQRMEERQNNSGIIYGSEAGPTKTDGRGTTLKDIRPQGSQRNADEADYQVDDKE